MVRHRHKPGRRAGAAARHLGAARPGPVARRTRVQVERGAPGRHLFPAQRQNRRRCAYALALERHRSAARHNRPRPVHAIQRKDNAHPGRPRGDRTRPGQPHDDDHEDRQPGAARCRRQPVRHGKVVAGGRHRPRHDPSRALGAANAGLQHGRADDKVRRAGRLVLHAVPVPRGPERRQPPARLGRVVPEPPRHGHRADHADKVPA